MVPGKDRICQGRRCHCGRLPNAVYPSCPAPQIPLGSSAWLPSFRTYRLQESWGDLMLRLILSAWLQALDARVVSAFTRSDWYEPDGCAPRASLSAIHEDAAQQRKASRQSIFMGFFVGLGRCRLARSRLPGGQPRRPWPMHSAASWRVRNITYLPDRP